jgi:hypothetical protein
MLILREIKTQEKLRELLSSQVDGSKTEFTTTNDYVSGTIEVYLNGQLVIDSLDYTETSSNTFEFTLPIKLGADIEVKYIEV